MKQQELFTETENLFEQLCTVTLLRHGFKAVKRNGGSPGIDGITIEVFGRRLEEPIGIIVSPIESGAIRLELQTTTSAKG